MRHILLKLVTIVLLALISTVSLAGNTITPQMIAHLKQLPAAEQQALARQYGVNPSTLDGSSNSGTTSFETVQTIQPRPVNEKPSGDAETKEKQPLTNFGYDLFAGQTFSHTPVDDLPVPNNYLIAAGDEIDVQLFGNQNSSYSLSVFRDGNIQFPELGPIHVAGQTFSELKAHLSERIKAQLLGVEASVSLGSLRMMQVYVAGDAYRPGAYNVPSLATVTQVLIAAGGFRKSGSLRDITVRRDNKVIAHLDLYNLLLKGDKQNDIRLMSGDTVFVGPKGFSASVRGEIRRPAIYEIKSGTTITQLIRQAGGSKASAYLLQVQVKRYQEDGIHVHTLDLTTSQNKQFILQDGDEVIINPVSDSLKNKVIVRGAVVRQGAYAYHQGMKITDLFTLSDNDFIANADLDYALVVREFNYKHDVKVLQFNINDAIHHPESRDNLALEPNDQVFVFASDLAQQAWQPPEIQPKSSKKSAPDDANPPNDLSTEMGESAKNNNERDALTGVKLVTDKKSILTTENSESNNQSQQQMESNSRTRLLKALIARLKQQAVNGQKVRIYEVRGAVRYPGIYPLVEGGRFKDAIIAAGGLLESAAKDQAELSRVVLMPGSVSLHHQKFDLQKALTNPDDDFLLASKDRLNIQRKTNWTTDNTVEIQGEVMHPGSYTINQGEHIVDLVRRAGGLTQYAYPQGAVFSREILRVQEQQRMKMITNSLRQEVASLALRRQSSSAVYQSSPSEAMSVVEDLANTAAIGRLVIDFNGILSGNTNADVILEGGDKLYIPPRRNTISVMGQVQMASNFTFDPTKSADAYINMAGGEKKQADTDRIYVIRANGAVMLPNQSHWFVRSGKLLESGDTVVVPIDTDYLDGLSTLSTATQMMYQIGVAWDAVK